MIVKLFGLELEGVWEGFVIFIEMCLFVKEGKEWFGYSYVWNEVGDDVIFVEEVG